MPSVLRHLDALASGAGFGARGAPSARGEAGPADVAASVSSNTTASAGATAEPAPGPVVNAPEGIGDAESDGTSSDVSSVNTSDLSDLDEEEAPTGVVATLAAAPSQ